MNFGSGAVPNIYMRRWHEVWRSLVNVVQSGLAGMATDTAGEMLATRGVSHFDSSGSNIPLVLKRLSPTHVGTSLFFAAGIF
jgi:hypothetical protein